MSSFWIVLSLLFVISVLLERLTVRTRRTKRSKRKVPAAKNKPIRNTSTVVRPDQVILETPFEEMSGFEFERLLALYFRDQGFVVEEVGVGGNDGGVDLVLIDKRGERTALQAKCYADHNKVPVQTVRELSAAKRNHNCILTLLVTTSDLTEPAKKEAEQFHVEYWHGGVVERKLHAWGKYKPNRKRQREVHREAQQEVAATSEVTCSCGSPMVIRKSKQGQAFYGCSRFPNCRHTRSIK